MSFFIRGHFTFLNLFKSKDKDLIEKQNRFSWIDVKLEFGNSWITFDVQVDPLTDINDDNALLDSIETGIKSNYDATVFEEGTDKYFINNQTAPYVIGTFSNPGPFGYSYDSSPLQYYCF
jgi:hypothetical protein